MANPSTNELIEWVEAVELNGIGLTSWEIEFIESMRAKIDRWGDKVRFSDNEAEKIEQVYSDRTP